LLLLILPLFVLVFIDGDDGDVGDDDIAFNK
jgi:hypothetical protein